MILFVRYKTPDKEIWKLALKNTSSLKENFETSKIKRQTVICWCLLRNERSQAKIIAPWRNRLPHQGLLCLPWACQECGQALLLKVCPFSSGLLWKVCSVRAACSLVGKGRELVMLPQHHGQCWPWKVRMYGGFCNLAFKIRLEKVAHSMGKILTDLNGCQDFFWMAELNPEAFLLTNKNKWTINKILSLSEVC